MNGADYSFTQEMLNVGVENRWITESIGGETRPDIQGQLFTGGTQVDDVQTDTEITHMTWSINQTGAWGICWKSGGRGTSTPDGS